MSIRESVIRSLYSSDLEWHEYESSIDRIAAFAHGSKLGRLLWRWKYGLEDWRAKAVLSETLRKAQRKFGIAKQKPDHKRLILVCEQALTEWYYDACRVCKGAGEVRIGDRLIVCKYCQGSAVQRWSRKARAERIGKDDFQRWEKVLTETLEILNTASANVSGEARYQLKFEAGELVK